MHELNSQNVQCPYCGELIEVLIDCSVPQQDYIEDCQVCCRPIDFYVRIDQDGVPTVTVSHENE
jgi:hypothetical protein